MKRREVIIWLTCALFLGLLLGYTDQASVLFWIYEHSRILWVVLQLLHKFGVIVYLIIMVLFINIRHTRSKANLFIVPLAVWIIHSSGYIFGEKITILYYLTAITIVMVQIYLIAYVVDALSKYKHSHRIYQVTDVLLLLMIIPDLLERAIFIIYIISGGDVPSP